MRFQGRGALRLSELKAMRIFNTYTPMSQNPDLARLFEEDKKTLLRSRVNVILLMGVFLVPLYGVIDYYLYPEFFVRFMSYRGVSAAGCLLLLGLNLRYDFGLKSFYLGVIAFYLVGLAIIKMIVDLGGYATPYYAGMNLVFIGFCAVLPIRASRIALHCAALYVMYVGMVFLINWPESIISFMANNSFVISTLVIVIVAAHVNHLLRWREFVHRVELEQLQRDLRAYSQDLEKMVDEKQNALLLKVEELGNRQNLLVETQRAAIFGLAKLAESRDKDTGDHLLRMRVLCRRIAEEMRSFEAYQDQIDDEFIENITDSCALHDLGKVAIPDAILLKEERLTEREYEIIKKHASIGGDTLKAIDEMLGDESFVRMGCQIAYSHHERYDGAGYPQGLKGRDIPLPARIVAVADVYDALTSNRCYKSAKAHDEAVSFIMRERNFHFDPDVVEAFLRIHRELPKLVEASWEEMNKVFEGAGATPDKTKKSV